MLSVLSLPLLSSGSVGLLIVVMLSVILLNVMTAKKRLHDFYFEEK